MSEALKTEQREQAPLERLERAQDRISEEYGELLDEEAAPRDAPEAPESRTNTEATKKRDNAAKTADPSENLKELLLALRKLRGDHLQAVLQCIPPHHLARALAQVLKPKDTPSAKQAEVSQKESNKRRAERARTLRSGKIIFNNKQSVSDCQIRDISSTGCRIALESPGSVPNYFTLHVVNGNAMHECEVVWRKSDLMGLKFLG